MSVRIIGAAITAAGVKARIGAGGELALIDLREEGVYAGGHPLFATSLPLGRLEFLVAKLVPRRSTPIVLYDDGDGLVERALTKLDRFGYTDLAVLTGGAAAWSSAGFELFAGWNVPSKALAEAVEHAYATPHIEARDLQAKIDAGDDVVVLDSRPIDEFTRMSIPGGIDCPGAELVYRAHDFVKDPNTFVVVNCAGRTRSIIGAQSLINSGLPNPVAALKNGTMGWSLAGLTLAHGEERRVPVPSPDGLAKAQRAAARVAQRFGVRSIDGAALARFRREVAERNLYIFDVRSTDEYRAGHVADARSAPGGQLVQATDRYAGVRNARIVLIDDDGVRATMTASWLVQLGVGEVYVLDQASLPREATAGGTEPDIVLGPDDLHAPAIVPAELLPLLARGAVVVDLDTSANYRKGHIPGAVFALRSRLGTSLPKIPAATELVLTAADDTLARFAAEEAASAVTIPVRVLTGGTAAWAASGLPLETGEGRFLDDPVDVVVKPYERADPAREMHDYLQWEVGLNAQLLRDGDAPFLSLLRR